jgi:membrane-associated protein
VSLEQFITAVGVIGVFAVVFAESGLLIGFFLPGDSLLFTAGLLVSQGVLDVPIAVLAGGCFIAAVTGDQVGYAFGRRVGPRLFNRPDSRFFRQEYVERAAAYFERYGSRTIVLARFIPIVRTFAPVLAGVGRMHYRTFVTYNVVGGLLWGVGVTLLGYQLGRQFPWIEEYLLPLVLLIIVVSAIPPVLELLKRRSRNEERDEEPERV